MSAAANSTLSRRPPGAARIAGLLLLLLPAVASAQPSAARRDLDTAGLFIEAAAGWDGTVSRSVPVSVSFLIRNDAEQMIEAELFLTNPVSEEELSLGEIVVSAKTARRVTSIHALEEWDECFAELRVGRDVLWRRELALTTGNEFDDASNFALFIDDTGRRLTLPTPPDDTTLYRPELLVGGTDGRRAKCLAAKSWQVPNHPAPLSIIQAVIFPEKAPDDLLNEVQWIALAKWMCAGGIIFVHGESEKIITKLIESAPLDVDAVDSSGLFTVRRVGLGGLYLYSQPITASEGAELRSQVATLIARLPKSPIEPLLDSSNYNYRGSERADLNRVIVLLFFLSYAVLIGLVSLVLFRLSQRRIAIYAGFVVAVASIVSGVLGGYLRFSRGDLNWTTVTQASAGGLVQFGKIDVRSAGGRNTRVAVAGNEADLQSIPNPQLWYMWNSRRVGHPAFTWQADLLPEIADTCQASVPMTPWGRRVLRATAFERGVRPLDFELKLDPLTATTDGIGNTVAVGKVSLKVVNNLPFDLTNCTLIIGGTRQASEYQQALLQRQSSGWQGTVAYNAQGVQVAPTIGNGLIDVYNRRQIGSFPAGKTTEESYDATFDVAQNDWSQMLQFRGTAISTPKIPYLGGSTAWIIGEISKSSILQIDEQHSDFDEEDGPVHLFLQEIQPGDLIDATAFLRPPPPAADNSAQPATE
jgi:hypothetical protein